MILPEGAESTLTENAASPFLAEPAHHRQEFLSRIAVMIHCRIVDGRKG